jgi:hypothetical protein
VPPIGRGSRRPLPAGRRGLRLGRRSEAARHNRSRRRARSARRTENWAAGQSRSGHAAIRPANYTGDMNRGLPDPLHVHIAQPPPDHAIHLLEADLEPSVEITYGPEDAAPATEVLVFGVLRRSSWKHVPTFARSSSPTPASHRRRAISSSRIFPTCRSTTFITTQQRPPNWPSPSCLRPRRHSSQPTGRFADTIGGAATTGPRR